MTSKRRLPAIVLAAGGSARFGSAKQVARVGDESLVAHAVRAARDGGGGPVIVVLGANAAAVRDACGAGVDLFVHNDAWRDGLAGSLSAGLRAVESLMADVDGVLITAADQPLVDGRSLAVLLAAFPGRHGAAAAAYDGVLGVPAAIGRAHFGALHALRGDRGAGGWLRANAGLVVAVPMPGAAIDVDTEADAERVRRSTG